MLCVYEYIDRPCCESLSVFRIPIEMSFNNPKIIRFDQAFLHLLHKDIVQFALAKGSRDEWGLSSGCMY